MADACKRRDKKPKGFYEELKEKEFKEKIHRANAPCLPGVYEVERTISVRGKGEVWMITDVYILL